MLEQKYVDRALEQALYYADRIPSPMEYPRDITSRGKSAIIAWLLVDTNALKRYDTGLDYWQCEITTALRDFGSKPELFVFPEWFQESNREMLRKVAVELRKDVGLKRIWSNPARINWNQDQMTIQQMLLQLKEEHLWDNNF